MKILISMTIIDNDIIDYDNNFKYPRIFTRTLCCRDDIHCVGPNNLPSSVLILSTVSDEDLDEAPKPVGVISGFFLGGGSLLLFSSSVADLRED